MTANGEANLIDVLVEAAAVERYRPLLGEPVWAELSHSMSELAGALHGRSLWNVNSTAHGGGGAELLASLIPYDRGAGIDERWLVSWCRVT